MQTADSPRRRRAMALAESRGADPRGLDRKPRTRDVEQSAPNASSAARARETRRLLERWHRDHDARAREELVTRFMPFARHLARRYYHGREPLEDLVQVASLGLVKAIDRFDLERTTSFTSFALPSILGELRRYFRDAGWGVHVPRGLQEQAMEVEKAAEYLTAENRRAPTPAEIAGFLGCDTEQVLDALELGRDADVLSLDVAHQGFDGEFETRLERLASEEVGYDLVEDRSAVASGIKALPQRERIVLGMRFLNDMTQTEIAAAIGVSQMQVSRLVRQALTRLQTIAEQQVNKVPAASRADG